MIHLFRTAEPGYADEVEEQLQDLVLAHEVTVVDERGEGGEEGGLPRVSEGDREYRGHRAIRQFLDEISAEVTTGRQMQSDSCVLDPDDPSQCL